MKDKFDSVIFDLDGTLWDATGTVARAWQAARNKVDYIREDITQEVVRSISGMTYKAIYDKLFPYLPEEQRLEFKSKCAKEELEHMHQYGGELFPGLEETLQYLQTRYRLFIVSNCQTGYIESFLEHHRMHQYFEGHQCYGTKNRPKVENIQDVVADYNLQTPVYVGDTQGDYEASRGAGVPFIFARFGFGNVEEGQIASVDNFEELKSIL
ncbi:HAD family hydrolase [Botryobacter ruber]|uniref:HAD family hydrolase n=1 Tax=Botryobacter ruber TaxID=2171629 RepID=UPI000E0AC9D0|nr:HAD family hydrolase [Botryobacter ruber]